MELIIKGDDKKIKRLEKQLRLYCKRNRLESSIKEKNVKNIEVKAETVKKKAPSKQSGKNK